MVTAESLAIGFVGVVLGLVGWAFSKIFDRLSSDVSSCREDWEAEIASLKEAKHDVRNRVQAVEFRISTLEASDHHRKTKKDG